jgi:3-methylcrotonyl-CoA carboxylase alpha subunit
VASSGSFANAQLDTALIPREADVLFQQDRVGRPLAVAAAVAQTLIAERATEAADPFSRRDGWRPFGLTVRRFDFEYRGEALQARLTYLHDGGLLLAVGSDAPELLRFDARSADSGIAMDLQFNGQRQIVQTWQRDELVHVFCDLGATVITEVDALAHAGEAAAEGGRLTAPMPGKVVSFSVKAGDVVTKGQALAVMEAMKMEHTIAAPADGTVAELLYAPGDQVAEGAELLKISIASA